MTIEVDGEVYPVEIIKKTSNKNTYFRVKDDLTFYVTTNVFTSDKKITKLIQENKDSIDKMYAKILKKQENNTGFFYLGKHYDIVLTTGSNVELGENKVFIGKSVDLDKWYKKQAQQLFQEHFDVCYQNFSRNIPYPKLRIRKMKSRWGVCNYKDIVVTLNLELIKRDLSCLDYVIYHELSHLIEANHSASFWSVVEENCPDYKNIRKSMKDY